MNELHDVVTNISLRDWFAGQALVALTIQGWLHSDIPREAYELADAMMKARKRS